MRIIVKLGGMVILWKLLWMIKLAYPYKETDKWICYIRYKFCNIIWSKLYIQIYYGQWLKIFHTSVEVIGILNDFLCVIWKWTEISLPVTKCMCFVSLHSYVIVFTIAKILCILFSHKVWNEMCIYNWLYELTCGNCTYY